MYGVIYPPLEMFAHFAGYEGGHICHIIDEKAKMYYLGRDAWGIRGIGECLLYVPVT